MGFLRRSQKLRVRVLVALIPSFLLIHQNTILRQSTSTIMGINYQSVSSIIDSMANPAVDQANSSWNAFLVLDVASVGSNTRLEYMKAQQETWASKDYIRHVFETTENDDLLPNCTISRFPTEQDIKSHVNSCRRSHKRDKFKHLYHYLHARWVLNKAHPAGWLCAQHRPGTALYKALQSYNITNNNASSSSHSLPDYLMLVDDDTYYDIPRLTPLLQASKHVATVYVGCLTILKSKLKQNLYRASPFGGGGMILSKQTLQRLLEPIHCPDADNNTNDSWCRQLDINLLGEQDVFRNGMTMGELIYQFYNHDPNCFISDWPLAYFINHYNLADVPWRQNFPDTQAKTAPVRILPITEASVQHLFYDDPQWKQQQQQQHSTSVATTNLCPLLQDPKTEYPPGILVGHYLSPSQMRQLYNQGKQ